MRSGTPSRMLLKATKGELAPMAHRRSHMTDRAHVYEQRVADALAADRQGLTLNEVREQCGGSVSVTSHALIALETQGRGRFDGRRWFIRHRPAP
jgi:hypothetical protein